MWGFWDKKIGAFSKFYDDGKLVTDHFETELEAITYLELMRELTSYPEQYAGYEVMELPADQPLCEEF